MRVVSLACGMPTGPPLHLYQILSYYLTVRELWPAQVFGFRGDNYIRKTVRAVSLACDIPIGPPLHSYHILLKYVYGIKVMEHTRMKLNCCFRGDNYITNKVRVDSLA